MKKFTLVSVLLVLAIVFSACGATVKESITMGNAESFDYFYSVSDDAGVMMDSAMAPETPKKEYGYSSQAAGSGSNKVMSEKSQVEYLEEKLVYTSNVDLETEDFDTANETLHSTIKSLGGIIVSENAYNLSNVGYRALNMTVRIPQENYETFLSGLSDVYNVTNIRNNVDNLTEQYYDNENRLKSYRVQEERLFAMLEKAETVEEMLQIESRLCDVQYQIEALTNTKKTIDNDVKYSTFYINLNEVTKYTAPTPKTFGDRLGETVTEAGEDFADFMEGLLFALIYFAPYIVIIAVVVIIAVATRKSKKKKKNAQVENKE